MVKVKRPRSQALLALTYCAVLSGALVYALRGHGVAQAQTLLGIGEAIPLDYLPVDTSELRINGARFHVHNARTTRPVAGVIDTFAETCALATPEMHRVLLGSGIPKTKGTTNPLVLRNDNEKEGMAGCFAPRISGALTDQRSLRERAVAFVRSQELAEFGDLRMVIARRGKASTHVLQLWNEQGIPLKQMFPASGDAPGTDPVEGLSAAGFMRTLSVDEPSGSYRFASYAAEDLDEARAHADATLKRAGFAPTTPPKGLSVPAGMTGYFGHQEMVIVGARVQAGSPMVGVIRLGHPTKAYDHE